MMIKLTRVKSEIALRKKVRIIIERMVICECM